MNNLDSLLNLATSTETPAGSQRVQEIIVKLRETDGVDLAAVETSAQERFEELYNGGEYDPDSVSNLEALADVTDAVRTVRTEHDRANAERDQHVSQLADRVRPASEDPADSAEQATTSDTGDQPEPGPEPADQPASASAPGDQALSGDETGGDPVTTEPAVEKPHSQFPGEPAQPAATSARVATPRRTATTAALSGGTTAARTPAPQPTVLRSFSITASAEIPSYPYGQALTMDQLADATNARWATLPIGQPATAPIKANVAHVHRHFHPDITLTGDRADLDTIDRVADEHRLPGGSLVAAAGLTAAAAAPSVIQDVWCSASETDFTLCPPLATTDGMIDLPTTSLPGRGGLRYPRWYQFPEQESDTSRNSWHGEAVLYPEPNPNSDPTKIPTTGLGDPQFFRSDGKGNPVTNPTGYPKRCIEGPCVDWVDIRQSLEYLCVTSSILQDSTWPELTQRFISDVLVHHQHYMNSVYINYIDEHSDDLPAYDVGASVPTLGSTTLAVTDRLALLVAWYRNTYRMAQNATLELVAPMWFKDFLARDIEKKSNRPWGSVSDQEIASIFAAYSSRVQWVYDWQNLSSVAGPPLLPSPTWPTEVKILAYPAGSWVLSQGNVLSLGVQYDFQLLQENRYAAMFSEDAWMLTNRCNRSFVLHLTNLCANGATGPRRDACPAPSAGSSKDNRIYMYSDPAPNPQPSGDDGQAEAGATSADQQTASGAATSTATRKR